MNTFKAKSSVSRWAKKEIGTDWKELGGVEMNDEGLFYYQPNTVVVVKKELAEEEFAMAEDLTEAVTKEELAKIEKTESDLVESTDGFNDYVVKKPILHKSTIGSPCRIVWDIAEEMVGAKRKDIIAACVEAGIAFYTARTQYQKYTEALKEAGSNA